MFNKFIVAGTAAVALLGIAGTAQAGKDLDASQGTRHSSAASTSASPASPPPTTRATGPASTSTICRAIAAAVLGDATKVRFVPTTAKERFTALQSGEIDVLNRNTTWTLARDSSLGLELRRHQLSTTARA